jgi:endonuclease/exonuclease/phosphatase family metal-dependent hydrolase
MQWFRNITLGAILFTMLGAAPFRERTPALVAMPEHRYDGSISVLTYNIKGLPWPVAWGRPDAFTQIARHLRQLHVAGSAPEIVVLQEAFTDAARNLGREAGYRYIVNGPAIDTPGARDMTHGDARFIENKHWWLGETEGKFVGSGLQILSDYPISDIRRIAFPDAACAGFDCLANKGALMVTVTIPGAPTPITVVTTHLNSRRASHSENSQSSDAYHRQVAALSRFIRDNRNPDYPLIVAGDFNVGRSPERRAALMNAIASEWGAREPVLNAYGTYVREGGRLNSDGVWSKRRARDWQFFAPGLNDKLTLIGITIPFGGYEQNRMLSDHVGYVARFRIDPTNLGAENFTNRG